jgi:RNA polymerase sigma-70 factor (ECF subfamily)
MGDSVRREFTQTLQGITNASAVDGTSLDQVFNAAYLELRRIAGGLMRLERRDHTLQPTELVDEAYLRLADDSLLAWHNRAHFFAIAARAMRQILVEHARRRSAAKRGGGWERVTLTDQLGLVATSQVEILDLEEALNRLAEQDERMARVVELRFFAGLTSKEVACVLGVSPRTVQQDWRVAKMWMSRELSDGGDA